MRLKKVGFAFCLSTALAAPLAYTATAQELPVAAPVQPASPPIQMIPSTFADLAAKLTPAVVNISTTQKMTIPEDFPELPQFPEGSPFQEFFEEFMNRRDDFSMAPSTSLGSGFIIDSENGYIVTNNHVVRDAEEIQVTFSDDSTVSAELIGHDEKTDIAVLKVDAKNLKLVSAPFGNSDIMRVGDWIIAIGNPFGLGGTVTTGIVSARARDINSGPYDDFLQTDASINRGNSGGPMFNLNGEIIGINTAIFSPSGGSVGIGFAIPSAQASPVVKQIIQYGRTRRGWLGVRVQMVTDEIAESLGLEKTYGALVASITKGGPAEKAGIQQGDIILKFNDQIVQDMKYLPRFSAEAAINSEARLTYWRDGKEHETKITVGELEKAEENGTVPKTASPKSSGKSLDIDSVGLGLKSMDESLRQEFEIAPDIDGVVITEVKNMSEAAVKGLAEGDVIVEINQQPVKTPEEVADLIDKAIQGAKKSVLLLLNSNGDVRFIALRLDKQGKAQPEEKELEP